MAPGSLFVALRGDNFNGHDFLPQAAAGGAIAALVDTPPAVVLPNMQVLQVADTRQALGKLACHVRQSLHAKVIAVAGSNGKTGTKHLIHCAVKDRLKGTISPKSYNNDIGVPLTIFPVDPVQDYVVLELGTNHPGEIANLAKIALPDVAVITNAQEEHLEFFGDLGGVRRENASIVRGLGEKGLLIVHGDDDQLLEAVSDYYGQRLTFGLKPTNDLFAADVQCDIHGVRFMLNGRLPVFVPLLGRHVAVNALAAIAVARRLAVSEEMIVRGLAGATGPQMRLQVYELGNLVLINDAYNANPSSTQAALETLAGLTTPGRRIAVLGDMRELGDVGVAKHEAMGLLAGSGGVDELVCIGELARSIGHGAAQAGMPADRIAYFADTQAAACALPSRLVPGDIVLLKASRTMHLEQVAEAIIAAWRTPSANAAS